MENSENQTQRISDLNLKMAKYKNECGCSLGAQFMSVAFFASLFFVIYEYHFFSMKFLSHLPFIALISIVAAGVGKLSGILFAKYKYNQISKQLTNYLYKLNMEEPNNAGNMD
jgi:hypothetical protein